MEYRRIKLNIKGLKNEFSIDTDGIVRNETKDKILRGTSINRNNRYVKIHLIKFHTLHKLVAEHFLIKPNSTNKLEVNHIDGNRNNNSVSNLEWVTHSQNILHAYNIGLKTNNGEKNPISKLNEKQVRLIWALKDSNLTARQIRDKLKLPVGIGAIKSILQGRNWSYITSNI